MNYARRIFLALAFSYVATAASACNIPVFRYALENWQPDPYRIAVVHRGAFTDEQYPVFQRLQQSSSHPTKPANVVVFDVDLDAEADDDERREIPAGFERLVRFEFDKKAVEEPIVALYFPAGTTTSIWQGSLTAKDSTGVIDSPARQEVTKRLIDGQSAVWIFVKTGDAAKDDAAEKLLAEKLELANEKVQLPDQSLIEAEDEFRADNPIDLRVEFSMISIDRNDPTEQPFVAMLLNSEEDIAGFEEPIAIPIFGRGRTYFALIGKGINEDTILDNCGFVCGACSCQVKQANPGIDTLMAFDWAANIKGSAMPDVELPELTGIGDLLATSQDQPSDSTPPSESTSPQADDLAAPEPNMTETEAPSDVAIAGSLTPEQTAVLKDHLDENVVKPMEQSMLMVMVGGTLAAAAFVFIVSLFIRRAV